MKLPDFNSINVDGDALTKSKREHEALVADLAAVVKSVADQYVGPEARCHAGICATEQCGRCRNILKARAVLKRMGVER